MLGGELKRTFSAALGWDKKELDLSDVDNLEEKIKSLGQKPTCLINCAAYNNVDAAENHKEEAFRVNAEAVGKISKVCQKLLIPIVHFSSNYVFDGEKGSYTENDQPHPISIYGQSKFEGEKLLQAQCQEHYLIRTSVLFGHEAQSEFSKKSFIEIMMELSQRTKDIRAVSDEVNSLTYVSDLARAVEVLITKKYPYGTYHIVNSGQASWYDFAKAIFEIIGTEVKLTPVKAADFARAAKRPKKSVLLNTKFPELRDWREALKDYLGSK